MHLNIYICALTSFQRTILGFTRNHPLNKINLARVDAVDVNVMAKHPWKFGDGLGVPS